MPNLSIAVNGTRIATLGLERMQIVDVSVHGGLDCEQKATLSATGGNYADGDCGHLIWIDERAILPGEVVSVSLDENCNVGDQGKTIKALFPEEDAVTSHDFKLSEEMTAQIRALPRRHEQFLVQVESSVAQKAKAASDELNTNFMFGVVWNWRLPNQARVRLTTSCLDDVLARTGGNRHLQMTLALGESVSFSLVE